MDNGQRFMQCLSDCIDLCTGVRGKNTLPPASCIQPSQRLRRIVVAMLAAALLLLPACADKQARVEEVDLSDYFEGYQGCFVLLDVSGNRQLVYNAAQARKRLSPCSTFKIPNSLIGLETGVIVDADFHLEWDGEIRDREVLNQDHTLRTAIAESVVWYYQELARRVGAERMQRFVGDLGYGNQDISSGLTSFWLGGSLEISALEQLDFLHRLQRGELPFSPRSIAIVQEIMILRQTEAYTFRGKTGSYRGESSDFGWFVGYLERGERVHVFAANIEGQTAWGTKARRITERILDHYGLW